MARPAEFDRSRVLEKATNLFWERGYFATSMTQLVDSTRLNPGSLYAAFTSKEGLLLAAIDFYGERSLARVKKILDAAASPIDGIREYLELVATQGTSSQLRRGCFMVNTALEVAPHNDTVKSRINHYLEAIENRFQQALLTAQAMGELAVDKDTTRLAKYLMLNIWGIRVMQRLGPDAETLHEMTQPFFELLEASNTNSA